MQKVVLSEISLIHGDVKTPKGYEINRKKIKNFIVDSYVNENRISNYFSIITVVSFIST